jgi:hypothetical protein
MSSFKAELQVSLRFYISEHRRYFLPKISHKQNQEVRQQSFLHKLVNLTQSYSHLEYGLLLLIHSDICSFLISSDI